jgi:hypothetical protein
MTPTTEGIKLGQLVVVATGMTSDAAARQLCTHKVTLRFNIHDQQVFGDVDAMFGWCRANAGQRHHDWYYRGGGTWCFRDRDTMVMFAMVWG